MKLTVQERLELLEIMPANESYSGIKEINRTQLLLALSGDEWKELEVVQEEGNISWNPEKAMTLIVDIPMGEWLTNTIRGILRQMDRELQIKPQQMSLFEKFVLDYE